MLIFFLFFYYYYYYFFLFKLSQEILTYQLPSTVNVLTFNADLFVLDWQNGLLNFYFATSWVLQAIVYWLIEISYSLWWLDVFIWSHSALTPKEVEVYWHFLGLSSLESWIVHRREGNDSCILTQIQNLGGWSLEKCPILDDAYVLSLFIQSLFSVSKYIHFE
jgi:hypothetical protein